MKGKSVKHKETCQACGKKTGSVYLHAKCHPKAPTWLRYRAGKLEMLCSVCGKRIATFRAVKERSKKK